MGDKLISVLALTVMGGMLVTALRPGAPTASVIGSFGNAWSHILLASEGRTA